MKNSILAVATTSVCLVFAPLTAASAQTAWARHVAADADKLLIGTIDRHNHASRATAQRVGRPRVLDDIFIALRASGIPLRDTM